MKYNEETDYIFDNNQSVSPVLINSNTNYKVKMYNLSKLSNENTVSNCSTDVSYLEIEAICYLFIMLPLAVIGIILNLISLKVFSNKSFNSVTFKYLRLITLTDFFICLVIIPYCVTAYTKPFNKYDQYARHIYLAYIYIPGANLAINLSMFLNLLVTIERLISVGWPTLKYTLFKPSRYYISCFIVTALAIIFNIANFFLYKVELCKNVILPRSFTGHQLWSVYGYAKEALTRIVPIIILVISNIVLIYIVKMSRKKMRSSHGTQSTAKLLKTNKNQMNVTINPNNNNKPTTEIKLSSGLADESLQNAMVIKNQMNKRNRQENQLTWMTIFVAILYLATSIPMVFAYPGLVFSSEQTGGQMYKMYAVLVNILELLQCSFRFLIYFCFTTQFRQVLYKLYGINKKNIRKQDTELVTQGLAQVNEL